MCARVSLAASRTEMPFSSCCYFFMFAVLSAAAAAVCLCHTVRFCRCCSHGIAGAVRGDLRFVTDTNGASVCACGRIVLWACHPERNEGRFQTELPLGFQERTRSIAAAVLQQQQCSNTSEPRNARRHRKACVAPRQLATRAISRQTYPEGDIL